MAEKEELNVEEKNEVPEEETEKKSKFPMKIVIIALLVLILSGGGFFLLKGGILANISKEGATETSSKGSGRGQKPDIGPTYSLETFIVNLVDPHGKKYLKVKLDLELDREEVREEIDKRLPQFRDTILTMLSSKTFQDISSMEGKLQLRAEIISMLNQYLRSGMISNIYFIDFIVQ
ncbi:MAG: flagellar basal body-associated FliL family protein [Deltaproteobacteria bacterium]|nr:flagellar basal body-associated FliL family protein [Deltaproteobacteria bacterium]